MRGTALLAVMVLLEGVACRRFTPVPLSPEATAQAFLQRSLDDPVLLEQPQPLAEAYAAAVRSLTVIIAALNGEIATMERQVTACFRGHPDAAIHLSQPGLGEILGARQLGEFGDDPHRYASGKARTIQVEVRKKRTFIKRDEGSDQPAEEVQPEVAAPPPAPGSAGRGD